MPRLCIILLLGLLFLPGCGSPENETPGTEILSREETGDILEVIDEDKREKLKELLEHTAYTTGAVLSHNYFGEVGDQSLWQPNRRKEVHWDYLEFHRLFNEQLLNNRQPISGDKPGAKLWQIENAYLKALNALELEEPEPGHYRVKKEALIKAFKPFENYLTREVFLKYCRYDDAARRYERFQEFKTNNFTYENETRKPAEKESGEKLKEHQVVIDKRIEPEVLQVLFKFFEGINENNSAKIESVISPKGLVHDGVLPGLKNTERLALKEIASFSKDDDGRPRYIINARYQAVYSSNEYNKMGTFVLHRMDGGWKIVDID